MIRNGIITITMTLLLTNPFANAGEITDTYPADSVLTSAKMENIKIQVNDNDDGITALETNKPASVHDRTVCSSLFSCPSDILTTTASTVTSVTIDVPSSGKVLVSFSGQYQINHTNATLDMLCIEIETSSTAVPFPACNGLFSILAPIDASHRLITIPSTLSTNFHQGGVHTQQVFTVTTGSHTYYLRGQSNSVGTTINLRQSNMIAHFIPD